MCGYVAKPGVVNMIWNKADSWDSLCHVNLQSHSNCVSMYNVNSNVTDYLKNVVQEIPMFIKTNIEEFVIHILITYQIQIYTNTFLW